MGTAQAQSDKNEGKTNETTYFIPLQSNSSGQSFGVAVKLGTEGPPGPDQKVIMKAKLVTQPVGKAQGATVIGASTAAASSSGASSGGNKSKKATESAKNSKNKAKVIKQESSSSSSDESSEE